MKREPRRAGGAAAARPRYASVAWFLLLLCSCVLPVAAEPGVVSPEGFSESIDGLPDPVVGAWNATVLIEGATVVQKPDQGPVLQTRHGSGVVLRGADDGGRVVVTTNDHVVTCGGRPCSLRVGFPVADSDEHVWTTTATVVSSDRSRDLAFVEVTPPEGAALDPARLVGDDCIDPLQPTLFAIGWPDLTVREGWGVEPPTNLDEHRKRYSVGNFLLGIDRYRPLSRVYGRLQRMPVVFHNADVLPGSSGGPVVDPAGDVVGINTQIVGSEDTPGHRYCARRHARDAVADCVHLAISSRVIAEQYERVFRATLPVRTCSPGGADELGRQAMLSQPPPVSTP